MFQLSDQHTWGNERARGAIRRVQNIGTIDIEILLIHIKIYTNTNIDSDTNTLQVIFNMFQL